jgi:hypothetical protein
MTQKPHYTKLEKQRSEEAEEEDDVQVQNNKRRYSLSCNLAMYRPQEIIVCFNKSK